VDYVNWTISAEEMNSVVDFIQLRGRVSITELSQESNKLIKLEPIEEKVDLKDLDGTPE
jgi:hypothetical protein